MSTPDWSTVQLDPEIRREELPDPQRIMLWVPTGNDDGVPTWKRVGNAPGEHFLVEPGVLAAPASLIELRAATTGLVGRLLGRFRRDPDDDDWFHPDGRAATQVGSRRNNWLFVVADNDVVLNADLIRARWPEATDVERIGERVFLVGGVDVQVDVPESEPLELAQQALTTARQAEDPLTLIAALTDLGVACRSQKKAADAVAHLDEALAICGELKDDNRELDVRVNLGIALLEHGDQIRAEESLERALRLARQNEDAFNEKAVLTYQAQLRSLQTDHHGAMEILEQALSISESVRDRSHSARLLWELALQCLKTRQFHKALEYGDRSVDRMRAMRHPEAARYQKQLDDFRIAADIRPSESDTVELAAGLDDLFSEVAQQLPGGNAAEPTTGPSLLGMAASAASAAGKAVRSGFQRVDKSTRQNRLRTCAVCEHHTGIRCKLCGCFTSVKSWLPFAECPIGKWGGDESCSGADSP